MALALLHRACRAADTSAESPPRKRRYGRGSWSHLPAAGFFWLSTGMDCSSLQSGQWRHTQRSSSDEASELSAWRWNPVATLESKDGAASGIENTHTTVTTQPGRRVLDSGLSACRSEQLLLLLAGARMQRTTAHSRGAVPDRRLLNQRWRCGSSPERQTCWLWSIWLLNGASALDSGKHLHCARPWALNVEHRMQPGRTCFQACQPSGGLTGGTRWCPGRFLCEPESELAAEAELAFTRNHIAAHRAHGALPRGPDPCRPSFATT